MSKLLKLKQWLTLSDAAKYLTSAFEEEITKADILLLAAKGETKLCFYHHGFLGVLTTHEMLSGKDTVERRIPFDGMLIASDFSFDSEDFGRGEEAFISGVEPLEWFRHLSKQTILKTIMQTIEEQKEKAYVYRVDATNAIWNGFVPLGDLFIAAKDVLAIIDANKPTRETLNTKERNTLLTIIAALCDHSAINHQERGAAAQLVNMTQEIGAAVSDDTIRKILKQIPDALESRTK